MDWGRKASLLHDKEEPYLHDLLAVPPSFSWGEVECKGRSLGCIGRSQVGEVSQFGSLLERCPVSTIAWMQQPSGSLLTSARWKWPIT